MQAEIPIGWTESTLGQLFSWSSGKKPTFEREATGRFPVFGSNGVLGYGPESNVERAFLIGRVGASGSIHVAHGAAWASDNTLVAEPISGSGDFDYLHQMLRSLDLASYATQTAQPLLTQGRLKRVSVALPPLSEQKKIAAVLASVDEAIRATEAVIEQTRRVKEGLLQDLLTRGIGHSRFKMPGRWVVGRLPEVEEIPDSWDIVPICDVARLESGHTPSRSVEEYWGGEIQWLSLHDTKRMERHVISSTALTITPAGIASSSARLLPEGTVALSRTATVGKCVILGTEMATSQDFACYVCGDRLHNKYLLHLFRYMQHVWAALSGGSTHQTVYMPAFEKLQIVLPPMPEQIRIAELMDAHDQEVLASMGQVDQLRQLKAGLLQDLLTGAVRVSP